MAVKRIMDFALVFWMIVNLIVVPVSSLSINEENAIASENKEAKKALESHVFGKVSRIALYNNKGDGILPSEREAVKEEIKVIDDIKKESSSQKTVTLALWMLIVALAGSSLFLNKKLKSSSKAMFFTLISLLFVSMLSLIFSSITPISMLSDRMKPTADRITSANIYITNFESSYLERVLRVSSYNALQSIILNITNASAFVDNVTSTFKEVILNGTIDGVDLSDYGINNMVNTTLPAKIGQMMLMASDYLHINMTYDIVDVYPYQSNETGPFGIGIIMIINYSSDVGVAYWNKSNLTLNITYDISDFDDPMYIVNTSNDHPRKFIASSFTGWNSTYLSQHIANETYKHDEMAPSFLMRFEGDFGNSTCCGIESVIDQGVYGDYAYANMSFIDYCYFGQNCPGSRDGNKSLYNVTGITNPPGYPFLIEPYHVEQYNLTEAEVTKVV